MDGKSLAKLAKDCKLIDKKLTGTDVDLTFAKVKGKTERRITYEQFVQAVQLFADKKQVDPSAVQDKICKSKGPVLTGTKAEAVKYHDDKSLYTGVYANGGPTNVDPQSSVDLSKQLDRSDADIRGVKQQSFVQSSNSDVDQVSKQMSQVVFEEKKTAPKAVTKNTTVKSAPAGSLEEVFKSYCGTTSDMDGKSFAKLAKDCKIISKSCTTTDIDLIFAKVKDKTARRINLS